MNRFQQVAFDYSTMVTAPQQGCQGALPQDLRDLRALLVKAELVKGRAVKGWSHGDSRWNGFQCRYCSGKAAMHYYYGETSPCQTEVEPCHSVGNSQGGLKQGGHVWYFCGYRSALLMHHHAMRLTDCSKYFKLIRSTSNSFDTA